MAAMEVPWVVLLTELFTVKKASTYVGVAFLTLKLSMVETRVMRRRQRNDIVEASPELLKMILETAFDGRSFWDLISLMCHKVFEMCHGPDGQLGPVMCHSGCDTLQAPASHSILRLKNIKIYYIS